jgi:hypothetical protein
MRLPVCIQRRQELVAVVAGGAVNYFLVADVLRGVQMRFQNPRNKNEQIFKSAQDATGTYKRSKVEKQRCGSMTFWFYAYYFRKLLYLYIIFQR